MDTVEPDDEARVVHTAIQKTLAGDGVVISWCLIVEVMAEDGDHYLSHRSGGGADGQDKPPIWSKVGMLQAGADHARQQLLDVTVEHEDEQLFESEDEDEDE